MKNKLSDGVECALLQGISPPNNESQQLKSGSVAGTMAPRLLSTIACRLTLLQHATKLR
jgi:hypothetical protein